MMCPAVFTFILSKNTGKKEDISLMFDWKHSSQIFSNTSIVANAHSSYFSHFKKQPDQQAAPSATSVVKTLWQGAI